MDFDRSIEKISLREKKELVKVGRLYVVSTHIGNKGDITARAVDSLTKADLVICEEIREGTKLLKDLNLSKDIDTLNEQNEESKVFEYIEMMKKGNRLALISDCGTPVFADPGYLLVKAALAAEIYVDVVPGVSSIMTALVRSGFPINQFLYAGFLSRKTEERIVELKELSLEPRTITLLETPYRLVTFLEAAAHIMPDRKAYIGINLTMPHESHHYGTFSQLFEKFSADRIKAEFVICFEGSYGPDSVRKAEDLLGDSADFITPYKKREGSGYRADRDRDRHPGRPEDSRGERKPFRRDDDRSDRKPFRRDDDRSDRKPFRRDDDRGDRKPFRRDEDRGDRKPFRRDDDRGDRKPFRRDEDRGDRKPFRRDEDRGDRKPFRRDDDRGDRKPFRRDDDRGDRKPFRRDDDRGDRKPFRRDDDRGDRKPFRRDDDRGDRKPFRRDDDRGDRKPFRRDDDRGDRKPFRRDEERIEKKPYRRDEGDAKKHYAKTNNGDKPTYKK